MNEEQPMSYRERLSLIRQGLAPKTTGAKPKQQLKKVSDKKAAEIAAAKLERGEDDSLLEKWFQARRKQLLGVCQCGCAKKSSKYDNDNFRSSIAHVFPKAIFDSVKLHPLNYVERNFWDGCHANFDNRGMDLWPMYADWDNIKEIFHELSPLLTDEERANKFYTNLEKIVYGN